MRDDAGGGAALLVIGVIREFALQRGERCKLLYKPNIDNNSATKTSAKPPSTQGFAGLPTGVPDSPAATPAAA